MPRSAIMDKNKIIAIVALVALGGLLLFAKSKEDPTAPEPAPTAVASAPTESDTTNSTDANSTDANAATSNATDTKSVAANAATSNAADAQPATKQGDVTKLQITDERVGTGPVAKAGDNLSMNYKGMLTNGEVFDQSYGRAPFDFPLGGGQVIKGWDEGIVGMKVGGKRKLVIPPDMGYGAQGAGEKIPGGATLIFEVELLSVNGKSS